jgi:hypothetical protein
MENRVLADKRLKIYKKVYTKGFSKLLVSLCNNISGTLHRWGHDKAGFLVLLSGMDILEAAEKIDKKNKTVIYTFAVDGEMFEARYAYAKKPVLELLHNGTQFGIVDTPKEKFQFVIDTEKAPVHITAWIDNGGSAASFFGNVKGVGIEVEGRPVQFTLADPGVHIKNGKAGLFVLLLIFAFKSIWTYYNTFSTYASHIVAAISTLVYLIPLLIVFVSICTYKTWVMFSLISGGVLSVLELIDYIFGILGSLQSGEAVVSSLVWILIRVSALYLLYNALKWKRVMARGRFPERRE